MYGFKHSDTCIINKIIQKYVTKFFLPSILVQELLHLKKIPNGHATISQYNYMYTYSSDTEQ